MDHLAVLEPVTLGFEARAKQYGYAGLYGGVPERKKKGPDFEEVEEVRASWAYQGR
jgi:hypothetical protein